MMTISSIRRLSVSTSVEIYNVTLQLFLKSNLLCASENVLEHACSVYYVVCSRSQKCGTQTCAFVEISQLCFSIHFKTTEKKNLILNGIFDHFVMQFL